jgi:hypothetical protein
LRKKLSTAWYRIPALGWIDQFDFDLVKPAEGQPQLAIRESSHSGDKWDHSDDVLQRPAGGRKSRARSVL